MNVQEPGTCAVLYTATATGPPHVSDMKGKVGTRAPPHIEYTANLPHQSAAAIGTTTGTSVGAPLGIGQLKLEGPMRYSSGQKPSMRAWLVEVEQWMPLMCYPPADWVDIVATRLDGAAST